jgi:hypothetical protein
MEDEIIVIRRNLLFLINRTQNRKLSESDF